MNQNVSKNYSTPVWTNVDLMRHQAGTDQHSPVFSRILNVFLVVIVFGMWEVKIEIKMFQFSHIAHIQTLKQTISQNL